ncbi:Ig domain-containing protein [Deltaproteobacteria bacterium IMCC39524]|nr:Ig domain-containing protein [Deltaproteobacteria bacterium IMCC39524]
MSIIPANPTASDCLRVVIQGSPGRSAVAWSVNGSIVSTGSDTGICPEHYRRDDIVTVEVGTKDQGAKASVTIGNSPPRIVDISSSPDEIFAGTDIHVEPIAEDADDDDVTFSFQWLINGEENPNYTEATLPGNAFIKGDELQVLVTPNDFYVDGPVYESYATHVPNAPPRIISEPPIEISSLDYLYQVEVSDPDDSQFTYRLDEGPEGMEIDPASGLVSWSLSDVEPGEYKIAIIVTDPEGAEGAQEYNLTLGAPQ